MTHSLSTSSLQLTSVMRSSFLFLAIACLTVQFASAQSTPTRSFMIGPTVGFNKTNYVSEELHVGYTQIDIPTNVYGGVDASYQLNRWLVGAKLLYQTQIRQASTPIPEYYIDINNPDPVKVFRTDSDYRLITVPLSVGYRLTPDSRLQWYAGGTVAFDFIAATGKYTNFSSIGITTTTNKAAITSRLGIGYGLHTTLRYALTPQVALQIEPMVHYTSAGDHQIRDSYQCRGAFAVLVKL